MDWLKDHMREKFVEFLGVMQPASDNEIATGIRCIVAANHPSCSLEWYLAEALARLIEREASK